MRLLKTRKPLSGPEFAIGLIEAKPVKSCDGGVFGALDSLLKTEHKKRNSKQRRRDRLAAAAWLRLFGCTGWHWRCGAIAEKLIAVWRAERCFFRSWFDSSKPPETVRWRCFRGLGFAPENGAREAKSKAPKPSLSGRCRLFAQPGFGLAVRLLKARKPRGGPEFAIGLIAAKPLKPCDGAFFRGFDSLWLG